MKTSLYRYFDASDQLLYVGIAHNPFRREKQHWPSRDMSQVRYIELEWFDDRGGASAAERHAIQTERPVWNVNMKSAIRTCRVTDLSSLPPSPPEDFGPTPEQMLAFSVFWHDRIYSMPACRAAFLDIFGVEWDEKRRNWVNTHMGPRKKPKPPFQITG